MFKRIHIVGRGRVGSALAARLESVGVSLTSDDPDLIVLCVPDRHVAEVAAGLEVGPWLAHVSGALPLTALQPHERRFSVHPLQTFDRSGRANQFDETWAAFTADSDGAAARAMWFASLLGVKTFRLRDEQRAVYHAGAAIASNYLVTLYRAASLLFEAAGAPPEALVPLMRRTVDNGFELTGPIARGDWDTVGAHRAAIDVHAPHLRALYDTLATATAR